MRIDPTSSPLSRPPTSKPRAWNRVALYATRIFLFAALALAAAIAMFAPGGPRDVARAEPPAPVVPFELPLPLPPSLKDIPVPEPPNLTEYVRDRQAAVALGKALFWDMQVGSDGVQACATCHFKAGADGRVKNQINPGADGDFEVVDDPNATLTAADFPFHQRVAPSDQQESAVSRDFRDIASSQGVTRTQFVDINVGSAVDALTPLDDPVFKVSGTNVRRVAGRNAPSVINAVFNYTNFHDGRANNVFNGVNPFGASDQDSKIFVNATGLQATLVRIPNASLASQAVGPPTSSFEMSGEGRTFPKIGKKMLSLRPLGQQLVATDDSVLGPRSLQNDIPGAPGLREPSSSYRQMIEDAFLPKYWENTTQMVTYSNGVPTISDRPAGRALTTDEFTQMEANFSLFFGLAIQLYETTLVSDDTLFDQVREGRAVFTPQQERGMEFFLNSGGCVGCHVGPEFTNHTFTTLVFGEGVPILVERMFMGDGQEANYDTGFYNIGVTRTADDIGRGANDPFGFPLSFARLGQMKADGLLPAGVADFVVNLPPGLSGNTRIASNGALKTPSLRNVELTGPYFHNGSHATLDQVMEFYARGGNFPVANRNDLDPAILELGELQGRPERLAALAAFLHTLTDERVRWESAPFDHPQIFVPHGASDADPEVDEMMEIPAVGAGGRAPQGLPPLSGFLESNRAPFTGADFATVPMATSTTPSANVIRVLTNDADPDGDALQVTSVTPAANGMASVGHAGSLLGTHVMYSPNPDFVGVDTFSYEISDGSFTATGSVSITVSSLNRPPLANSDTPTVNINSTENALAVLSGDIDFDNNSLTVVAVSPPATAGSTTAVGPAGAYVHYVPAPGFAGADSFSYTVSDGALTATAQVTVIVNRPPLATDDTVSVDQLTTNNVLSVLVNDIDPDGNTLNIIAVTPPANGTVAIGPSEQDLVYTPNPGFTGADRVSYVVTDNFLVDFATVSITVVPGVSNQRIYLPLVQKSASFPGIGP